MKKFIAERIYHALGLALFMAAVFVVYPVARLVVWLCGDWTSAVNGLVVAWLLAVILGFVFSAAAALKK